MSLRDTYLWYDKVPRFYRTGTSSPEQVLEELMYRKMDKWSYLDDSEEYYELHTEARFAGVGFEMQKDEKGNLRVSFVHEDSPADRAGIKRGFRVLSIGGHKAEDVLERNLWLSDRGKERGVSVDFVFEDLGGNVREEKLVKDWISVKTTVYHRCFDVNGVKVGYLVFDSFLETSLAELNEVFAEFKKEGISELVLDLRYNEGGDIDATLYLGSLISGAITEGKVFAKVLYNNKYSDLDYEMYFGIDPLQTSSGEQYLLKPYALDLKRLVVITTDSTASASELLINGLKPFIEVIQVGSATYGKPVGSQPIGFGDSLISLINFRMINAEGEGNYFKGFQPTCPAVDDLTRPLGDPKEASLKEALYYLKCGECSQKANVKEGRAREPAPALPVEAIR